jgi:hypothetical protein
VPPLPEMPRMPDIDWPAFLKGAGVVILILAWALVCFALTSAFHSLLPDAAHWGWGVGIWAAGACVFAIGVCIGAAVADDWW